MSANDDSPYSIFLDKTALLAYMDTENPYYRKASTFFMELDDLDRGYMTTQHIIYSVHQWLRDTYGYVQAEFFLNVIDKAVQREKLYVVSCDSELEKRSRELLQQYAEYQITLEEALNAAVMSTYRINRIFTFNRQYGFLQKIDADMKVIPSVS